MMLDALSINPNLFCKRYPIEIFIELELPDDYFVFEGPAIHIFCLGFHIFHPRPSFICTSLSLWLLPVSSYIIQLLSLLLPALQNIIEGFVSLFCVGFYDNCCRYLRLSVKCVLLQDYIR